MQVRHSVDAGLLRDGVRFHSVKLRGEPQFGHVDTIMEGCRRLGFAYAIMRQSIRPRKKRVPGTKKRKMVSVKWYPGHFPAKIRCHLFGALSVDSRSNQRPNQQVDILFDDVEFRDAVRDALAGIEQQSGKASGIVLIAPAITQQGGDSLHDRPVEGGKADAAGAVFLCKQVTREVCTENGVRDNFES